MKRWPGLASLSLIYRNRFEPGRVNPKSPIAISWLPWGSQLEKANAINQLAPFDRLKKYQCLSNEGNDHAQERQSQN